MRVFKNNMARGVPFPHDQPMRVYSSIWDAEGWATQGGRVKTDWSQVPFTAYYKGFDVEACYPYYDYSKCKWDPSWAPAWYDQQLDWGQKWNLNWVNDNLKIYDYCQDHKRFPEGVPAECTMS
jgi:Xyloglucan endo-transglycosylase (XET) C-terminus/Glycosyl hydrolases family 16